MPALQYELAIFGSTPLARLISGLLAAEHGKRVVLIAETPSPFRLPTGIDLSVMPITRPESWALLKTGTSETLKLLRRIGARRAIRHIDPIFIGETERSTAALSHMRQMAMGFGFAAERVPCPHSNGQIGVRLRDAVLLDRPSLAPVLSAWLGKVGVVRLEARRCNTVFRRDGSVGIDHSGQMVEAAHAVLADDEAILAWLGPDGSERLLSPLDVTAMLVSPKRPVGLPFVHHVDRGVTLMQQRNGQVLALGLGRPEEAARRVGGCLANHGTVRRVGQREFRIVTTRDGAPLAGPLESGGTSMLAGFGSGGLFFAPALARQLAGASSTSEGAYFTARQADRGARSNIAEYASPAASEPVS